MKAHYTPSEKHPARTMLDFVRLLKRRYQSILSHTGTLVPLDSHGKEILSSLCLGEAFLEKGDLLKRYPTLPTQIAVIGPTQAGKSSVVNLLLGGNFAEISPLAGFTTFPQGFALELNDLDNLAIEDFFQGYRRIASAERAASPNGVFSLSCVPGEEQPLFGSLVVWDTPDFDSIHSANYYNSLLKAIALADVVLLAVSKDKYADQTVWNILGLIESLRQPMVIVLNKIAPENCSAVIQSFREKWQSSRSDPMPPIVAVPFLPKGIDAQNAAKEHGQLIAYLEKAQSCIDRGRHRANSALLLQQHWPAWTEAVRQEQNLRSEWNRIVDNATDEAIEIYQRDYLNHPQHFETFNRALAELLILLEIPGVAPVLAKTRQILTWPIRQILGFHRSRKFGQEPPKSQEMQILERMFEHFMIQLFGSVLTKRGESGDHQNWWDEISVLLKPAQEHLSQSYTRALKTYLTDFNREIEAAAHRLYEKLEHQPATLNSLRATRFITDAAGVATALHTGGIGIQDLVLTPAFFALTSFLTESALGQYMRRVEAELKQKQLSAVSTRLFHEALTQELKNLPRSMTPENKFNISVDSLEDAEKQLHAV